jgi:hypothetical protein
LVEVWAGQTRALVLNVRRRLGQQVLVRMLAVLISVTSFSDFKSIHDIVVVIDGSPVIPVGASRVVDKGVERDRWGQVPVRAREGDADDSEDHPDLEHEHVKGHVVLATIVFFAAVLVVRAVATAPAIAAAAVPGTPPGPTAATRAMVAALVVERAVAAPRTCELIETPALIRRSRRQRRQERVRSGTNHVVFVVEVVVVVAMRRRLFVSPRNRVRGAARRMRCRTPPEARLVLGHLIFPERVRFVSTVDVAALPPLPS